jgi:methylated-DNA-[protein]-cysteine S-methyltransferase
VAHVYDVVMSPVGELLLLGDGESVSALEFDGGQRAETIVRRSRRSSGAFADARAQLAEYFAGARQSFDLVLRPAGTPFQQLAWRALTEIPYGATRTYGEQAASIGRPGAARAVGAANSRNPIPIIVPCHRLVGHDGGLTGFGGGLERKRYLLEHEATVARRSFLFELLPAPERRVQKHSGHEQPCDQEQDE